MNYSHLPLMSYFILIGYLLNRINPLNHSTSNINNKNKTTKNLFQFLSICSLISTWSYMFLYFKFSFDQAKLRANSPINFTTNDWLLSTSLFKEAWSIVCFETEKWWYSQMLCLWTVGPFTIFLFQESKKKGTEFKPWAYMLLGQVVAISFAQNLFLAELEDATTDLVKEEEEVAEDIDRPNWLLCTCVYLSIITVALSPNFIYTEYFLPNLLIMHLLILIPLFSTFNSLKEPISFQSLYYSISILNGLITLPTYFKLFPLLLSTPLHTTLIQLYTIAIKTLFSNPASSSIGFDVIFTTISFLIWIIIDSNRNKVMNKVQLIILILFTPIIGISVTGSFYLGLRENNYRSVSRNSFKGKVL